MTAFLSQAIASHEQLPFELRALEVTTLGPGVVDDLSLGLDLTGWEPSGLLSDE